MSLHQSTLTKSQQVVLYVGTLITSLLGGLFFLRGDFAYCSYDTMTQFLGFNPYGWTGINYAIEFAVQQALDWGNPILLIFFSFSGFFSTIHVSL